MSPGINVLLSVRNLALALSSGTRMDGKNRTVLTVSTWWVCVACEAVGVGERAGLLPRAEQRAQRPVVSRAAVVEAPARRVVEADALGRRQRGAGAVLAVELAGRRACALNVARDPRRHANLRSRGAVFCFIYRGAGRSRRLLLGLGFGLAEAWCRIKIQLCTL